jgi:hypothetical protein
MRAAKKSPLFLKKGAVARNPTNNNISLNFCQNDPTSQFSFI